MDDEDVRQATRRWVEADLIEEETADAIVAFEGDRQDRSSRGRITTAIAIMGAILVGVGLLAAIATAWDAMNDATRTVLLVAAPILAGAGGIELDRRDVGRAGTGLWILATLLIGPCLFMLGDIHRPRLDGFWLLLVWGILALPMGHAFRTRIGTAVGLIAMLLAIVTSGAEQTGLVAAGLVGSMVAAASIPLRDRAPTLVETYRVFAVGPAIVALLWITTAAGVFENLDIGLTASLWGALFLALAAAGASWWMELGGRATPDEVTLVAIPVGASALGLGVVLAVSPLGGLAVALLGHGVLVLTLVATVAVGVRLSSAWLVNLVAVGFLLQVLSLLMTFVDDLSGALALIVVGMVLLLVAILLERGRRRILGRLRGEP